MLSEKGFVLFAVLLIALQAAVFAQAPDTLWTKHYGGSRSDEAWQLKQTPDGGFIVVGYTGNTKDILLLKTDSSGDWLWIRSYDFSGEDVGRSVEILEDGGFILTGVAGDSCTLLRTDSLGNEIWHTNLDSGYGRAIRVTSDGNFIIAGYKIVGGSSYQIYIAKAGSDGSLIWSKTYGGNEPEMAWDIRETPDGGFIILGWTESFGNGLADIYLLKTDSSGDTLWTRTYGNAYNDEGRSIIVKDDGGFVLAGKLSQDLDNYDISVINADSDGIEIWSDSYIQDGISVANSIIPASGGGYVITGMKFDSKFSSFIMKIRADGDSLWTKMLIDSTGNLYCRSIVQTEDGGYVIAGYHQIPNHGNDVFLCKLAPDITGTEDEITSLPDNITLQQNYPNPFNANTTISFRLAKPQNINLSVYDLLGRKVEVLLKGFIGAGNHKIKFDAGTYPSGLYFYRLEANNYSDTRMMLLLK
ncbi:MAG: T9SS type A sorting domain-containing protein [Candidatus Zixiibacteriota bacterium]|nr:MAG: T9SS type A sorting domain-containing protein [candidate division Zixibacteria bacterium]